MRILGIVALGAAPVAFVIPAGASCSQPLAPSCASRFGAFDDQDDFDQCKRKMASYQNETEEFLSCVQKQGGRFREEYNSAVETFNRRARD